MILYNTTFVMGEPSERAFLEFMKEVYLPTLAQDDLVEEGSLCGTLWGSGRWL